MVKRLKLIATLHSVLILGIGLALVSACDSEAPQHASPPSATSSAIWLSPDSSAILGDEPSFGLAAQESSTGADDSLATMELPAGAVCAGIAYRNGKGQQVTGTRVCAPAACDHSNQTSCVTQQDFPAIDPNAIKPDEMTVNATIAGVTGTFSATSYQDCTATNQANCTSTATYLPIEATLLKPANIKAGVVLSPTLTGAYPSAAHPLVGAPVGGAPLNTKLTEVLTAAKIGYFWLASGKVQTVTGDNRLHANNLLNGHTAYGVAGTAIKTLPPACTKDDEIACTVTPPMLAVKPAELNAAHIKKGVTIGGVTGIYPSDAAPLANASSNIPNLDLEANYDQLRSVSAFEYFDRTGKQYQNAGDPQLTAANIKSGETVLGVTGTLLEADKDSVTVWDLGHEIIHEGDQGQLHAWNWCYNKTDCDVKYFKDYSRHAYNSGQNCSSSSKTCVFRNLFQEIDWAFPLDAAKLGWENAGKYCKDLDLLGKTNWRLASQKEAMQSATNGIINLEIFTSTYFQAPAPVRFWTSTAANVTPGNITRVAYAADKDIFVEDKADGSVTHHLACVRDLEPEEAAAAKRAQ